MVPQTAIIGIWPALESVDLQAIFVCCYRSFQANMEMSLQPFSKFEEQMLQGKGIVRFRAYQRHGVQVKTVLIVTSCDHAGTLLPSRYEHVALDINDVNANFCKACIVCTCSVYMAQSKYYPSGREYNLFDEDGDLIEWQKSACCHVRLVFEYLWDGCKDPSCLDVNNLTRFMQIWAESRLQLNTPHLPLTFAHNPQSGRPIILSVLVYNNTYCEFNFVNISSDRTTITCKAAECKSRKEFDLFENSFVTAADFHVACVHIKNTLVERSLWDSYLFDHIGTQSLMTACL